MINHDSFLRERLAGPHAPGVVCGGGGKWENLASMGAQVCEDGHSQRTQEGPGSCVHVGGSSLLACSLKRSSLIVSAH
jgi:hypothetical protein